MAVKITEVRVKLMDEQGERLQAFCSITFDDSFVVRDLKIIEGASGPFVAMPSRKLTAHCPHCGSKNHLRAAFCNQCGNRLYEQHVKDEEGRAKLYADIAHPINTPCREMIQERVIRAFEEEVARSQQPGYVSRYDDFDVEDARLSPHIEPACKAELACPSESDRHQGAERQQGPHKIPVHQAHANGHSSDGFGAGIFE
jgi:stage V sporulation protein G